MRIAVLGAGVTGGVIAREMAAKGHEVVVYEASSEVGGLVASHAVGGTPLEIFYHHIFTHEHYVRDLIDELGVDDKLEWLPSSVGILDADDRIWPFTSPRDLLTFGRIPVVTDGVIYRRGTGEIVDGEVYTQNIRGELQRVDGVWRVSSARLVQQWEGVAGCAHAS